MKKKIVRIGLATLGLTAGDVLQRRQIYKFFLDSDAIAIE